MALQQFSKCLNKFAAPSQRLACRTIATVPSIEWETKPFKYHGLDVPIPATTTVTGDEARVYYKQMLMIRRMEAEASKLYKEKIIRGFCHLYSGQEACAVGIKGVLEDGDSVITAYRCHGWTYLMGRSVRSILAELCGKKSGCTQGKGGSMHMYAPEFYGGNGIVGAQVPVGAGVALAYKYNGQEGVSVSLYGDGASNQGQVFEAYNIAKLWDLPAIFVCENNKYGMGTSAEGSSSNTDYYTRGDYVPGLKIDAMDVLAVKNATAYARQFALENGPIVLEMETYRYHGHSMSDPDTTYRQKDEIKLMRNSCPILQLKAQMVTAGFADEAELKALEKGIRKEVTASIAKAEASGQPGQDQLIANIYSEPSVDVRGCDITILHN